MEFVDDLTSSVIARLRVNQAGSLLAAWQDGSVSLESLDFEHQKPRGPLATFPTGRMLAWESIQAVLRTALEETRVAERARRTVARPTQKRGA